MTPARLIISGAEHARNAVRNCLDDLHPLLDRMPEGGLVGQARAVIQDLERQLNAALREIGDEQRAETERPPGKSQEMKAVKAGGVLERVNEELAKGRKK